MKTTRTTTTLSNITTTTLLSMSMSMMMLLKTSKDITTTTVVDATTIATATARFNYDQACYERCYQITFDYDDDVKQQQKIQACARMCRIDPIVQPNDDGDEEEEDDFDDDEVESLIGGGTDQHGCFISAGYTWSEELQQCVREWENENDDGEDEDENENEKKNLRSNGNNNNHYNKDIDIDNMKLESSFFSCDTLGVTFEQCKEHACMWCVYDNEAANFCHSVPFSNPDCFQLTPPSSTNTNTKPVTVAETVEAVLAVQEEEEVKEEEMVVVVSEEKEQVQVQVQEDGFFSCDTLGVTFDQCKEHACMWCVYDNEAANFCHSVPFSNPDCFQLTPPSTTNTKTNTKPVTVAETVEAVLAVQEEEEVKEEEMVVVVSEEKEQVQVQEDGFFSCDVVGVTFDQCKEHACMWCVYDNEAANFCHSVPFSNPNCFQLTPPSTTNTKTNTKPVTVAEEEMKQIM